MHKFTGWLHTKKTPWPFASSQIIKIEGQEETWATNSCFTLLRATRICFIHTQITPKLWYKHEKHSNATSMDLREESSCLWYSWALLVQSSLHSEKCCLWYIKLNMQWNQAGLFYPNLDICNADVYLCQSLVNTQQQQLYEGHTSSALPWKYP